MTPRRSIEIWAEYSESGTHDKFKLAGPFTNPDDALVAMHNEKDHGEFAYAYNQGCCDFYYKVNGKIQNSLPVD